MNNYKAEGGGLHSLEPSPTLIPTRLGAIHAPVLTTQRPPYAVGKKIVWRVKISPDLSSSGMISRKQAKQAPSQRLSAIGYSEAKCENCSLDPSLL